MLLHLFYELHLMNKISHNCCERHRCFAFLPDFTLTYFANASENTSVGEIPDIKIKWICQNENHYLFYIHVYSIIFDISLCFMNVF